MGETEKMLKAVALRILHRGEMPPTRKDRAAADAPVADPADTTAIESSGQPHHYVRNVGVGVLLALVAAGGAAALPGNVLGPVGPAVHSVVSTVVPGSVTSTIHDFVAPQQADPQSQQGAIYMTNPDGTYQVLAGNGQTSPTGHTLPASAVANNRVVIGVEGIGDQINTYSDWTHAYMQHTGPGTFNVGQPVETVHEGELPTLGAEVNRSTQDIASTKVIENGGHVNPSEAYANDPAVKTLHDVIQQQLDAGHDVVLVPHSGGGPESALALNMLSQQGYHAQIGQHVRVMSLAGAAAPQDYADAGVQPQNILYTASHQDPIGNFGRTYIDPANPQSVIKAASVLGEPSHHTNTELFQMNTQPDGHNVLGDFMAGGPGGNLIR